MSPDCAVYTFTASSTSVAGHDLRATWRHQGADVRDTTDLKKTWIKQLHPIRQLPGDFNEGILLFLILRTVAKGHFIKLNRNVPKYYQL